MFETLINTITTRLNIATKVIVQDFAEHVQAPRRILLIKLDHLGDFLMTVPALEHLRRSFADAEITLVCGSWNTGLALDSGLVDHVVGYDYFPQNAAGWNGRPVQDVSAFKRALNGRYDLAVDLRVNDDTRFLLRHVDALRRAGFGTRERFPFLDIAMMQEFENRNVVTGKDDSFPIYFRPDHFSSRYKLSGAFGLNIDFSVTDRHVVWGPYYSLPPGKFRATFGLLAEGFSPDDDCIVQLDIARDQGKALTRRRLTGRDLAGLSSGEIELEFDNPLGDSAHEFRIYAKGRPAAGMVRFQGVRLDRVGEEKNSTWRPSQIHKGEHIFLLACLIVERFRPPGPMDFLARPASEAIRLPAGVNVVLAPFSNSALRDWPAQSYRELIERLLKRTDYNIVIVGTLGQTDRAAQIIGSNAQEPRIVDLVGRTAWEDMPSILQQASVVVCNNSGLAHLAAAIGAPTLALYSGSHEPSEWGPRGQKVRTITASLPCSPCGIDDLSACKADHRCMLAIQPPLVLEQIQAMIRSYPLMSAQI